MKSKELLARAESECLVLDGGMGTLLQAKGLGLEELPEEWNLLHPDTVSAIHLEYLEAGAQIIEANTFGGSPLKLALKGKGSLVRQVNRQGVECALEAVRAFRSGARADPGGLYVAGSIGPSGKVLDMDMTRAEAEHNFSDQALILAEAGADLCIVETMFDLKEAEIAVSAAARETALPVFGSLVFNRTIKGEFRTLFGNLPSESAKALIDAGASAVGANCGLAGDYVHVIREMRKATRLPLLLYPNAGRPILREGRTFFEQSPLDLIGDLREGLEAGATIVGGCCGTTPEYIRLVSEKVRGRKRGA